jgi:hypothetical protein
MTVTNPLAITFCNGAVRPVAERFALLYYECKSILAGLESCAKATYVSLVELR